MEVFASLRESADEIFERNINSYLKTVKEKGVEVISVEEDLSVGITEAEINMKPFLKEKVVFEFGGSGEYFNVWYHEFGSVRLCAEDFVENFNALELLKDAARDYLEKNKIKGHEPIASDNHDHSWLLSNKGWM